MNLSPYYFLCIRLDEAADDGTRRWRLFGERLLRLKRSYRDRAAWESLADDAQRYGATGQALFDSTGELACYCEAIDGGDTLCFYFPYSGEAIDEARRIAFRWISGEGRRLFSEEA